MGKKAEHFLINLLDSSSLILYDKHDIGRRQIDKSPDTLTMCVQRAL